LQKQQQAPFGFAQGRLFGDDKQEKQLQLQPQLQPQPQIPFGDDKQKGNGESKMGGPFDYDGKSPSLRMTLYLGMRASTRQL
jgi:hypothetical protein